MDAAASLINERKVELTPRQLVVILGVPVDAVTMNEALDRIDSFVRIGRKTGRTHQITTVNADFVVNAINDPEVRLILQESDLAIADGMPVVLGANLLGTKIKDRVTGADMVPLLAQRAAEKGFSIYFLGAAPGVAAKAAQVLKESSPALKVSGVCSPPFGSILEMDPAIISEINEAKPDILLVAFGNPKQEKWIAMHRYELHVPVMIGIGGTLDFITGNTVRAPRWMQKSGLEWLHRLIKDPRRLWRRYVVDFAIFGTFFLRQLWLMKRFGKLPVSLPVSEEFFINGIGVLRVRGTLTVANLGEFSKRAAKIVNQTNQLVIDFSEAEYIDSLAVGTLVHLSKELHVANGNLFLVSVPQQILRTLEMLHLDQFLNIKGHLEDILYQGENVRRFPSPLGDSDQHHTVIIEGQPWYVIHTPRRIDASNADQLRQDCLKALEKNTNLLLDFSETVILASAGLAVLANLSKKSQELQHHLMLKGINRDVMQVIKIVKFDQFLRIE